MKKSNIISGIIVLTVTSVIIRIIGFIFRIFLSNKIGAEGMGLYQLLVSVYTLGATFSVSGINVVVSSLVAYEISKRKIENSKSILRTSIVLTTFLGLIMSVVIYYNADFISINWMKDIRIIPAVKIVSFCFPFISVFACLNGYFTGICEVKKPMTGQIIEQLVRIFVIYIFIDKAMCSNIQSAIALTAAGIVLGEMVSAIFLIAVYLKSPLYTNKKTNCTFFKKIISMCVPLSISSYFASIFHTVENMLIPQMLIIYGQTHQSAISTLGVLKGMVLPILFFPCSFLGSITTMLLPTVSAKRGAENHSNISMLTSKVLKLTFLMSGIIIFVFIVFAKELGFSLYKNQQVSSMLIMISPVVMFIYVDMVLITVLNAFEKQTIILKNSFIELMLRLILLCTLIPKLGFNVYIFIVILTSFLSVLLNYNALNKIVYIKFEFLNWVFFPLICGLISTIIAKFIPNFILGIFISFLIYFVLLIVVGSLKLNEIKFVFGKIKQKK